MPVHSCPLPRHHPTQRRGMTCLCGVPSLAPRCVSPSPIPHLYSTHTRADEFLPDVVRLQGAPWPPTVETNIFDLAWFYGITMADLVGPDPQAVWARPGDSLKQVPCTSSDPAYSLGYYGSDVAFGMVSTWMGFRDAEGDCRWRGLRCAGPGSAGSSRNNRIGSAAAKLPSCGCSRQGYIALGGAADALLLPAVPLPHTASPSPPLSTAAAALWAPALCAVRGRKPESWP